jgi:DNA-binding IclR family transcriptional regulator
MKSVRNALVLLGQFTHARPEHGVTDLSRALNLDKGSVHRYLRELESLRFVERDPETRLYHLGLAVVELAGVRLSHMRLVDLARPHLGRLWRETGETVQLSTLAEDSVFYLAILESPQPIRVASRVGERAALHATAAGKVLLAHLPEECRERILARPLQSLTPKTVIDPERLRAELSVVRQRGCALDDEGFIPHLRAAAAPVFGPSGEAVAAVAVGGPSIRVTRRKLAVFSATLREVAARISRGLGYDERDGLSTASARPAQRTRSAS